ncbi:MAG: hypothetical protein K2N51_17100 [Lachnospiraceae bacterium]|nr:hypothetical protein [Lachnospiraceae bacterium]
MINKSYLSEFKTPITDRTAEDVNNLRALLAKGYNLFTQAEKELWAKDHKGALNASDLNRIASNSVCLGKCLGITISSQEFLVASLPTTTQFNTLKNNLQSVITEIKKYTSEQIPTIPNLPFNDYIKINLIEEIQLIIYNIIKDIEV